MKTFLFQGDSITDCGRSRQNDQELGHGYPTMAAGRIHQDYPGQFRFLNRAVGGDRSIDLYARIKADIINLAPDYLSVLIGVNDVWHELGGRSGCSAEQYERNCRQLYEEVKAALPEIRIFVLEPFLADGDCLRDENGADFRRMVEKNAFTARKLAEEYGLVFVPLQQRFDEWAARFGAEAITREGVHPTLAGHSLIAAALLEAFEGEI